MNAHYAKIQDAVAAGLARSCSMRDGPPLDAGNEKRPVLIVVAGPNGAGKTTITEQLLVHKWSEPCEYINPDNIARDIFGDWNNAENSLKAAQLTERMREDYLREQKSIAFETVMSADDKVAFIRKAKAAGYFVRLFFVCTNSPTINASRVTQRVMQGGHAVPIDKIVSRYYGSIANAAILAAEVDRSYFYDNSYEDQDARLMFRANNGTISNEYGDIEPWADLIRLALAEGNPPVFSGAPE